MNLQYPSRFLSELPESYVESAGSAPHPHSFPPGTSVYHHDYGTGQVWKEWDNGRDTVILVRFETGKTAQFLPEYSDLEKISSDEEW